MKHLIGTIIRFRDERNWEEYHNPKDLAISITLEATELLELFQWVNNKTAVKENMDDIKDELADVLIYALTFAHQLDIDVESAILNKIEKNALKYPIEPSVHKD